MPWFNPVIETFLGKELPGEVESLLFCVQTGIGVGIIAYYMGRFVERKTRKIRKNDERLLLCKMDCKAAAFK